MQRIGPVAVAVLAVLVATSGVTGTVAVGSASAGDGDATASTGDGDATASTGDGDATAPAGEPRPPADASTASAARSVVLVERAADNGSVVRGTPDEGVVQAISYRRVPDKPGHVEVEITYRVGSDVKGLVVYPPDSATVTSVSAFERKSPGRYFTNSDFASASLTLEVDLRPRTVDDHEAMGVATEEWALVGVVPGTGYYSSDTGQWEYEESDRVGRALSIEGEGLVTDRSVFLGNYTVSERVVEGQRLRLVVPGGSEPARSPDGILDSLANVSAALDVGARDGTLYAFYLPVESSDVLGLTFSQRAGSQEFYAYDPGWNFGNTWFHEYVHTRQAFEPAPDMEWFSEASANYYEKLFALRYGIGTYDQFRSAMRDGPGGVLADRDRWRQGTQYVRGQIVLAALDAKIRAATDYRRSLVDVFRLVNEHQGTVTLAEFKGFVERVAGTSMDAWIETHVAGGARVTFQDDPFAYTDGTGESDPDGDGLDDAAERAEGTHPFRADTDGDALPDGAELDNGTDPAAADTDGDGLDDGPELEAGADPTAVDTDGDGLDDGPEVENGLDPAAADTDGDGLDDPTELEGETDPAAADTDDDGLADGAELEAGADPTVVDTDGDGLEDGPELEAGADPTAVDTDGDGLDDGPEVENGLDPAAADTDGDGLDDPTELEGETDPTVADTDGDGLADGAELDAGADPTAADTDGDGLEDGPEVADYGSDPTAADTDGEGLADGEEVDAGTDPAAADTDGDGFDDAAELSVGTDPTGSTGTLAYSWARLTTVVPGGAAGVAGLAALLVALFGVAVAVARYR